jgi:hypothetical protein
VWLSEPETPVIVTVLPAPIRITGEERSIRQPSANLQEFLGAMEWPAAPGVAAKPEAGPLAEKTRLSRHSFSIAEVAQTNADETKALLRVQADTAPKK